MMSVKGLKTVWEVISNVGGAENVPISHNLLNSVKHAWVLKEEEERDAKRKRQLQEEAALLA